MASEFTNRPRNPDQRQSRDAGEEDIKVSIDHLDAFIRRLAAQGMFSKRTIALMKFDLLRVRARFERRHDEQTTPSPCALHIV